MSRCLGPLIADLADGRLAPAEAERAYAHVAVCAACRDALAAQRAVIARLDTSTPLEPTADLLGRLRAIPSDVPAPEAPPAGAGVRPTGAAGTRPAGRAASRPPRRRSRVALAGAAGAAVLAVALAVGGSAALAAVSTPGPAIAPVVDVLTDEHAASVDQMPLSGPRIVTVEYVDPAASASPQP